ncbi:MAG: heparinase II/III family protein [Clostridia bacterium]
MKTIDWKIIHETINGQPWAGRLYSETREQLDKFIDNYEDHPSRVAGWFHHYNCGKCDGRLIFNIDDSTEHVCSVCGQVNRGETLTRAWNNMYRGHANASVYNSAVAYNIEKDEKYIRHIKKVLWFYAENYDEFVCDPPAKRFEGKIQNQHLDDAVGMMTIILGMDMVHQNFNREELDALYMKLFSREADLFDFFANRIYNIPVWIKCAQAMIGVFFGRQEHIEKGFYSQFGILDQLEKGVTEEGMWYEGSMHYHFYTLQPIAYLLYIMARRGFVIPESPDIMKTVERMFEYPLKMMFSNRRLPNPNDAHPLLTIDMYRPHYEYAAVLFDNPRFKDLCGTFYMDQPSEGGFTRLLFNRHPGKTGTEVYKTVNNPDSCTAMLRDKTTEVFFKYGLLTHLHRHPDVMNLEISFAGDVVSYDIGNGGYASPLFVEWQRKTIAHNTVAVDGRDQYRMSLPRGVVEEYDEKKNMIRAKAKAVYEAVDYERSLEVRENLVFDRFLVRGWGEYTMDWFFYCTGELLCPYPTAPVDSLGTEEGYQHLFEIQRFEPDGDWHLDFIHADKNIRLSMKEEPNTEVFFFNSYTASREVRRKGVMVRRKGEKTLFDATYQCLPL